MDKRTLGYVEVQVADKIATITFSHPAHNSMPGHLLQELRDAIKEQDQKKEVNVIILKSGGDRTFCAGASFEELTAISNPEEGKTFFMGFANVIKACRDSSKIIIGRIQGKAVGGGVGLISAVDYAVASKYAGIRLSELELGIGPFVIGPAVERKVGVNRYAELALTPGEWRSAEWAYHNGLYHKVLPSNEELNKEVAGYAAQLATYNPEALTAMKKVIWENTDHWNDLLKERAEMSGRLVLSDFTKQAIHSIKSKTK